MRSKKGAILVVEDSFAVAKRLESTLENAGFSVQIARNGEDAWRLAQKHLYDLVITDEQMPKLSGRELCKRLRGHDRYANTPVIVLSAAEFGKTQDDVDLLVSASFTKPFSPGALLRAVESELSVASKATRCGLKPETSDKEDRQAHPTGESV